MPLFVCLFIYYFLKMFSQHDLIASPFYIPQSYLLYFQHLEIVLINLSFLKHNFLFIFLIPLASGFYQSLLLLSSHFYPPFGWLHVLSWLPLQVGQDFLLKFKPVTRCLHSASPLTAHVILLKTGCFLSRLDPCLALPMPWTLTPSPSPQLFDHEVHLTTSHVKLPVRSNHFSSL